jgi:diadenosine tetraphosphate (Ap4A) HIT family hydrolase
MSDRKPFDLDAYIKRIQSSPCFICEMIAGRLNGNHIVQQNDEFIIFLNKYPTLYGYTLIAPIEHKEQVTADFSLNEYLALQRKIYQTAEAVRKSVDAERVYILSLGSQQGNRHVHWHIAPLPSEVPFKEQQIEALKIENGILDIPDEEMERLAKQIQENIRQMDGSSKGSGEG